MTSRTGFTLIELSIVLVIIGLIVGGVLVGRDLIAAAQIRATVAQIESFNAAANTFRGKYSGLPGDLKNAANFGFAQATGTADGAGSAAAQGDDLVTSCRDDTTSIPLFAPYGFISFGCENSMFWTDLSQTGLIAGGFSKTDNATAFIDIVSPQLYIPVAKLAGNYIFVAAWQNLNYFYITGLGGVLSNTTGSITAISKLTPTQAFQIDSKLDDGSPITGTVLANDYQDGAGGGNMRINLAAGSSSVCRNASNGYNIGGAPNNNLCQLMIRASF